jgi:hypothetical protein
LLAEIEKRHAHGEIAWQFRHSIQDVVVTSVVLIMVSGHVSLFGHGAPARSFLVGSICYPDVLLCGAL